MVLQRTLFSIISGVAADLRKFSAFPAEEELIIPAGTVFKVITYDSQAHQIVSIIVPSLFFASYFARGW